MKINKWPIYNDLAWTESIVFSPSDYLNETEFYIKAIKEHSEIEPKTLLHLGCGAGGHDYTFKKYYTVTGVDISAGMLEIAQKTNPEVTYVHGDMRSADLKERFDAVAMPDCIDYMTTLEDLRLAINTAITHLKSGGVLLIVANTREEFNENNFVYSGSKGDIDITIFENNYGYRSEPSQYQATFIYLIRRKGRLSIHTDCHTLGLFPEKTWLSILSEMGLKVSQIKIKDPYDRYILHEGEYHLQAFISVNGN